MTVNNHRTRKLSKEPPLHEGTSHRTCLKMKYFPRTRSMIALASLVVLFNILSLFHQNHTIINSTQYTLESNFRLETHIAKITADNDVKKQQQIIKKSTTPLTNKNPTWLTNYIIQHNNATQYGTRLKEKHPYVIYTCNERELCGGIGDRIMGMIKAFYVAVYENRTLIIDDAYPHPISDFLEPSKVFWNVSFPETTMVVDKMKRGSSFRSPTVVGYRLGRCNGQDARFFFSLMKRKGMKQFIPEGSESFESSLIDLFRLAFETLFQFSDVVKKRAVEMMMNVELQRDFQKTRNGVVSPYIGLHHRDGDDAIVQQQQPTTTEAKNEKFKRKSDKHQLLKCYQTIQKAYPGEYQGGGYIASDSNSVKEWMHLQDPSVCYVSDMIIYHVDKSPRENNDTSDQNTDHQQSYQGTLDTYAELVNLINADCLIMANSFFSFMAYYIRDPRFSCSVHVEDCNEVSVKQRENLYYYYESYKNTANFFKKLNTRDALLRRRGSARRKTKHKLKQ